MSRYTKFFIFFAICVSIFVCGCSKSKPPTWDKCTLSSNWHGSNAQMRMMNMLSPHMSESSFNDRLNFMKSRGCNTANVFLTNKSDGEYSGYSIYGNKFDWNIDDNYVKVMLDRIKKLRKEKFAVVLWLIADDSNAWAKTLASNPARFIGDLDRLGFFKDASIVVLGLEMDEYFNASQVTAVYSAVKSKWKGMIGTHHTSGKFTFYNFGDILFYQVNPGTTANSIISQCKNISAKTSKKIVAFEIERHEDRNKCQQILDSGAAYSVGNW